MQASRPITDPKEIRALLSDRQLFLGDQAPWSGGHLREVAVRQHFGIKATYFHQDMDLPWIMGVDRLRIHYGWKPYWSLACRYPWSFSVPGLRNNDLLLASQSPRGLATLLGPVTRDTIWKLDSDPELTSKVIEMLDREREWAMQLREWAGLEPVECPAVPQAGIKGLSDWSNGLFAPTQMVSMYEWFRDSPAVTATELPEDYYWYFTKDGLREREPGAGRFAAPRAHSLILEFAARGWVFGCTKLSYMQEVLKLRDQYLPGLPLRFLHISFSWTPEFDPLQVQLERSRASRISRGKKPFELSQEDEQGFRNYNRHRLSSISAYILKGELSPLFQLIKYR